MPMIDNFGETPNGASVERITLCNGNLQVSVLTWGAILQDVRFGGSDHSLTLGSDNLSDYFGSMGHHGAIIGPIANRIGNARIKIDGLMYELERNQDDRVHLHSGVQATHRRNWQIIDASETAVTLLCHLPDGDCGLPGNRDVTVTYHLEPNATLVMDISASSDESTAFNFANHAYWNLDGSDTWRGHQLQIAADEYLPTDTDHVPTGEISDVLNTPYDFRTARVIAPGEPALDTPFCLSESLQPMHEALVLTGQSGVRMSMATTAPGLQVYDNRSAARPGCAAYEGLAFEAQHWPDAPNHASFPSIIYAAGKSYRQTTCWQFSQ